MNSVKIKNLTGEFIIFNKKNAIHYLKFSKFIHLDKKYLGILPTN